MGSKNIAHDYQADNKDSKAEQSLNQSVFNYETIKRETDLCSEKRFSRTKAIYFLALLLYNPLIIGEFMPQSHTTDGLDPKRIALITVVTLLGRLNIVLGFFTFLWLIASKRARRSITIWIGLAISVFGALFAI